MIAVDAPGIRLRSLNETLREHPRRRHARQGKLFAPVGILLSHARPTPPTGPLVVTITRVGGRVLDDDNFRGGDAKALRDWIATRYLGRDDKESAMLAWDYVQATGPVGVRVAIAARAGGR